MVVYGSPKSYICVKYRVWAEKWREPGMCKDVHSRLLLVLGIADALSSPQHNIAQINEKNGSIFGDMVNSYRSLRARYLRSITLELAVGKNSKTTSLLA